MIEHILRCL